MKLPVAISGAGNDGIAVFRGIREGSRVDHFQFWALDESYASTYGGKIIAAEICDESSILDLRDCVDENGDYDGAKIEEACAGLADAMGIDAETIISRDQLWDCSTDDHAAAVAVVRAAGFDGWAWFEGSGDDEAYCLFVAE